MFLNAQSVKNKALDICDYTMQAHVDLVFLRKTLLRPECDEADYAALTPPGFCLKSLPRQSSMFLEQFSNLLESHVSCDRIFVVGDLIVHFDKPSDPSISALNVVLDNLSLHQLVKVPTHQRGHTSDWLLINHVSDVLDLTVIDMLLSDHFVISFDLLLKKAVRKRKYSREIRL